MVNLAKLRKKAKDKKEKKKAEEPPVEEPQPRAPAPADKIAEYLATAGDSRAVARAEPIADTAEHLELLTFIIAGEQYAIAIDDVVEIVTPRPVTRIPNADSSIIGILSLRGAIVMVVDARRRLNHPPAGEIDADTRIIVVQQNSENVGFFVDHVLRVVKVDASEVQGQPVVHSSEHDDTVRGVFRYGDALTILLDLSKLISTNSEWN